MYSNNKQLSILEKKLNKNIVFSYYTIYISENKYQFKTIVYMDDDLEKIAESMVKDYPDIDFADLGLNYWSWLGKLDNHSNTSKISFGTSDFEIAKQLLELILIKTGIKLLYKK